jgi:hypothetical protein
VVKSPKALDACALIIEKRFLGGDCMAGMGDTRETKTRKAPGQGPDFDPEFYINNTKDIVSIGAGLKELARWSGWTGDRGHDNFITEPDGSESISITLAGQEVKFLITTDENSACTSVRLKDGEHTILDMKGSGFRTFVCQQDQGRLAVTETEESIKRRES